jgi:hypothetical protein
MNSYKFIIIFCRVRLASVGIGPGMARVTSDVGHPTTNNVDLDLTFSSLHLIASPADI